MRPSRLPGLESPWAPKIMVAGDASGFDVELQRNGGTAEYLFKFLLLENKSTCGFKGLKFTHIARRRSKKKYENNRNGVMPHNSIGSHR